MKYYFIESRRNIKNSTGFTMIELLLGLTLFSLMAATLYGTYAGSMKIHRRSENLNDVYREARWVYQKIEKDLDAAVEFDFASGYPDLFAFTGEKERVVFLIANRQGLQMIEYSLEDEDYGQITKTVIGQRTSKNQRVDVRVTETQTQVKKLVRKEWPLIDFLQASRGEPAEVDILSSKVTDGGLEFSFAMREAGTGNISWESEWAENGLPAGLRVGITFMDQDNKTVTLNKDVLILKGFWTKPKSEAAS
jgi:prepilin-type N-terminal cleavage/methylation domain-containing protein